MVDLAELAVISSDKVNVRLDVLLLESGDSHLQFAYFDFGFLFEFRSERLFLTLTEAGPFDCRLLLWFLSEACLHRQMFYFHFARKFLVGEHFVVELLILPKVTLLLLHPLLLPSQLLPQLPILHFELSNLLQQFFFAQVFSQLFNAFCVIQN